MHKETKWPMAMTKLNSVPVLCMSYMHTFKHIIIPLMSLSRFASVG